MVALQQPRAGAPWCRTVVADMPGGACLPLLLCAVAAHTDTWRYTGSQPGGHRTATGKGLYVRDEGIQSRPFVWRRQQSLTDMGPWMLESGRRYRDIRTIEAARSVALFAQKNQYLGSFKIHDGETRSNEKNFIFVSL